MNFQMKILDIFYLSSGFVIFVGPVIGTKQLLRKKYKLNLLINGVFETTIETSGEWIADRRHPLGHRSISTLDDISLTSEFVKENDCMLLGELDL